MRTVLFVIFFSLSVCFLMVQTVVALEIIYPADGTYFVKSNYLVIKGGQNPPLDGLVVELNGVRSGFLDISSVEYKTYLRDIVILQPEFEGGENSILIEGYYQGQVAQTATAKTFFQKDIKVVPPIKFRPYVMHTPEKESLCAECHNMDPTTSQMNETSPVANPCASCHSDILKKKNVHGPAGVFRCAFCHDPASRPVKYKARSSDVNICGECHLEQIQDFYKSEFVHGPVVVGLCSVCHDSHSSDNPVQMLAPINDVCIGCHSKVDLKTHVVRGFSGQSHPLRGVADPSQSGKVMSCVSCHKPHGGANRVFFEKEYSAFRMALCRKCHKK